MSYLVERRGLHDATRALPPLRDFLPLAAIYGFALLLFVIVKDLGPAVLLFGAFLTLLYLNTQRAIYPLSEPRYCWRRRRGPTRCTSGSLRRG